MGSSRTDKIAYAITISFLLFLLFFGGKFHIIEQTKTAERDGYVSGAEQIRLGNMPKDPFHPFLYPILSAGMGSLLNNTFSGARLTSSIFAALFVLLTYLFGRLCFNRAVGMFALLAMVLNFHVIRQGVHTTSDMTAAALTLIVLFCSIQASYKPELGSVLTLAVSFVLAYLTRYASISLIPAIIISLIYRPAATPRKKIIVNLATFAIATLLLLLPYFFVNARIFGTPFHNDNWKNLAFKLYGRGDWTYFSRIPFNGLMSVILHSPTRFIASALRELWAFIDPANPALIILGGKGIAGFLFAILSLAGVYYTMFFLDRKRILAISFLFSHVVMVCAVFVTSPRIMLPILPLLYILGGHFFLSGLFPGSIRFGNINIRSCIPAGIIFLFFSYNAVVKEIPIFIAMHPTREIEAALMLERNYGRQLKVLGTSRSLQYHVKYRYYYLNDGSDFEKEKKDKNKYYDELKDIIGTEQFDYIIIGRLTLQNRPKALLLMKDIPSFLSPIFYNADVVVYKVERDGGK